MRLTIDQYVQSTQKLADDVVLPVGPTKVSLPDGRTIDGTIVYAERVDDQTFRLYVDVNDEDLEAL